MTREDIEQARELFGPAPTLSSEEPERFEKLYMQLATAIKPQDFTELLLVWNFACESWNLNRYTRHAAVAIERRHRDRLQFEAQRAKFEEKRRLARVDSTLAHAAPADVAALTCLEEKFLSAADEVGEILDRKVSERDHNIALQKSMVFQEQLDKLMSSANRRRDDALDQLEIYRAGLGAQAKEIANQILDGEFEEAASIIPNAPALIPADKVRIDGDK